MGVKLPKVIAWLKFRLEPHMLQTVRNLEANKVEFNTLEQLYNKCRGVPVPVGLGTSLHSRTKPRSCVCKCNNVLLCNVRTRQDRWSPGRSASLEKIYALLTPKP